MYSNADESSIEHKYSESNKFTFQYELYAALWVDNTVEARSLRGALSEVIIK